MKFEQKKNGDTTYFKLKERKLDSTVAPTLKAEYLILCKPKVSKKLVIDLHDVQFCDSSGLSALLIAERTMREHGGELHLVNVNKKVLDLLKISQLDRYIAVDKTVAEATKN